MSVPNYGIVGLGVMGRNLAWNLHGQHTPLLAFSISEDERQLVRSETPDLPIVSALSELVSGLSAPRVIFLMVTAGVAVDQILDELLPLLEPGDIVVDGGNSLYLDTEARIERCRDVGIDYLGAGISGGETGARHGASVMVGGSYQAFIKASPLFERIACEVEGDACFGWMGNGGAGHFVKTVHNGIEYAIMQLIAESYDFMRRCLRLSQPEIRAWFADQQGGALDSYLLDITVDILAAEDDLSDGLLLEQISDRAQQKGTGRWCVDAAMTLGVPAPTMVAAVTERQVSSNTQLRSTAAQRLDGPTPDGIAVDGWSTDLADALYAGMLVAFAQGLALISGASAHHGWETSVTAPVRLWRGGCIIRATMLKEILAVGDELAEIDNLLLAPQISSRLNRATQGWRRIVSAAVTGGVPIPANGASIAYVDSVRSERLPTNLIQAQRDYFGAHTFERVDRDGSFHVQWQAPDA